MQSTGLDGKSIPAALRGFLESGMSYSRIADAINAKFNTAYSRSAAIGPRQANGGLPVPTRRTGQESPMSAKAPAAVPTTRTPSAGVHAAPCQRSRRRGDGKAPLCRDRAAPIFRSWISNAATADILYGGDEEGEAITFCGHPQRLGTSYCVTHFHLTRGARLSHRNGPPAPSHSGSWRRHETRDRD